MYAMASVKRVWPALPGRVQARLQSGQSVAPEAFIETFIDELTLWPVSFDLILEAYHTITTPAFRWPVGVAAPQKGALI
jgi:hypothetical protein